MSKELIKKLPKSILDPDNETNIALWALFAEPSEEIDQTLSDISLLRSIDTSSGVHLDNLGSILQESRDGRDDEEYRDFLRIIQKVRLSNGSVPELVDIAKSICGDYFLTVRELVPGNADAAWYDDVVVYLDGSQYLDGSYFLSGDILQPSCVEIRVRASIPDNTLSVLDSVVRRAKAAGINYRIQKVEVCHG